MIRRNYLAVLILLIIVSPTIIATSASQTATDQQKQQEILDMVNDPERTTVRTCSCNYPA